VAAVTYGLAEQASVIIQEESFTVPSSGVGMIVNCLSSRVMMMMMMMTVVVGSLVEL
jgi:hypothetical protein